MSQLHPSVHGETFQSFNEEVYRGSWILDYLSPADPSKVFPLPAILHEDVGRHGFRVGGQEIETTLLDRLFVLEVQLEEIPWCG